MYSWAVLNSEIERLQHREVADGLGERAVERDSIEEPNRNYVLASAAFNFMDEALTRTARVLTRAGRTAVARLPRGGAVVVELVVQILPRLAVRGRNAADAHGMGRFGRCRSTAGLDHREMQTKHFPFPVFGG